MCYNCFVSRGGEKGVTALPPLFVHFPSNLTCPLEPHRTVRFIAARLVSRATSSNAHLSFHSFDKEAHLHPSDCKGFVHSAKKSVLASPPESRVCAPFHKTPGVYANAKVTPNLFLLFPQAVNIERTQELPQPHSFLLLTSQFSVFVLFRRSLSDPPHIRASALPVPQSRRYSQDRRIQPRQTNSIEDQ